MREHLRLATLWVATLLTIGVSGEGTASAETIHFADGVNGQNVGSFYSSLGIVFAGQGTQFRFHDSTVSGNVAFPFVDDWGIVINGGSAIGHDDDPINIPNGAIGAYISFLSPIDYLKVDSVLQSANFDGLWSLVAFDINGAVVDSKTATFAPAGPGFLFSTLQVSGPGSIDHVLLLSNRKFGVDTLQFLPDFTDSTSVPEPASFAIWGIGLCAVFVGRRLSFPILRKLA